MKRGMTLIEVLIASVILTIGMLSILQLFSKSQRLMLASSRFEIAQRVLVYGEMAHPMPTPRQVGGDDPEDNELLNIDREDALDIIEDLEEMSEDTFTISEKDRKKFATYTFERKVDEIDDEELERNGGIYTVRTIVTWGGNLRGTEPEREEVVKLWRKGE